MIHITRFKGVLLRNGRNVSYLPRKLNYYEILGVKSDATADEIRAAFVRKSHELHPDRSSKPQEKRRAWRRKCDTELFMQVKEAYDCLRKPEKRAAYDDQLVTSAGYLKEATHLKFQDETIVDLNRARNDNYTGPRGRNSEPSHHFRDLEEEYYQEKHKNRMLVVLAGVVGCLILANISYVWHLRRSRLRGVVESPAASN